MAINNPTSHTAELQGVTIHAPKDLAEWLAPFDGHGANDIARVAGLVGSGDLRVAAENVLKAADGSGNLPDAINVFLELSSNLSS